MIYFLGDNQYLEKSQKSSISFNKIDDLKEFLSNM